MVEPIRKLPPEQLAQIAYEDATPDDQLTPEELRRKTDRAKQRVHRENKKAEKAAATAKAKRAEFDALCESFPDHQTFWQHQRSRLTEAERANYEFLHQQSTDTSFAMLDYLAGTDGTSAEERAEFISDVSKMNADLVPTELLAVPEFWKPAQRQLFARISNRSETARVFCNYGYHLGVMNHVYVQFVAKFHPASTASGVGKVHHRRLCQLQNASQPDVGPAVVARRDEPKADRLQMPSMCSSGEESASGPPVRGSQQAVNL